MSDVLHDIGSALTEIYRLPNGEFAPAGRGRVLRPHDYIKFGRVRGRVNSDGRSIHLLNGTNGTLAAPALQKANASTANRAVMGLSLGHLEAPHRTPEVRPHKETGMYGSKQQEAIRQRIGLAKADSSGATNFDTPHGRVTATHLQGNEYAAKVPAKPVVAGTRSEVARQLREQLNGPVEKGKREIFTPAGVPHAYGGPPPIEPFTGGMAAPGLTKRTGTDAAFEAKRGAAMKMLQDAFPNADEHNVTLKGQNTLIGEVTKDGSTNLYRVNLPEGEAPAPPPPPPPSADPGLAGQIEQALGMPSPEAPRAHVESSTVDGETHHIAIVDGQPVGSFGNAKDAQQHADDALVLQRIEQQRGMASPADSLNHISDDLNYLRPGETHDVAGNWAQRNEDGTFDINYSDGSVSQGQSLDQAAATLHGWQGAEATRAANDYARRKAAHNATLHAGGVSSMRSPAEEQGPTSIPPLGHRAVLDDGKAGTIVGQGANNTLDVKLDDGTLRPNLTLDQVYISPTTDTGTTWTAMGRDFGGGRGMFSPPDSGKLPLPEALASVQWTREVSDPKPLVDAGYISEDILQDGKYDLTAKGMQEWQRLPRDARVQLGLKYRKGRSLQSGMADLARAEDDYGQEIARQIKRKGQPSPANETPPDSFTMGVQTKKIIKQSRASKGRFPPDDQLKGMSDHEVAAWSIARNNADSLASIDYNDLKDRRAALNAWPDLKKAKTLDTAKAPFEMVVRGLKMGETAQLPNGTKLKRYKDRGWGRRNYTIISPDGSKTSRTVVGIALRTALNQGMASPSDHQMLSKLAKKRARVDQHLTPSERDDIVSLLKQVDGTLAADVQKNGVNKDNTRRVGGALGKAQRSGLTDAQDQALIMKLADAKPGGMRSPADSGMAPDWEFIRQKQREQGSLNPVGTLEDLAQAWAGADPKAHKEALDAIAAGRAARAAGPDAFKNGMHTPAAFAKEQGYGFGPSMWSPGFPSAEEARKHPLGADGIMWDRAKADIGTRADAGTATPADDQYLTDLGHEMADDLVKNELQGSPWVAAGLRDALGELEALQNKIRGNNSATGAFTDDFLLGERKNEFRYPDPGWEGQFSPSEPATTPLQQWLQSTPYAYQTTLLRHMHQVNALGDATLPNGGHIVKTADGFQVTAGGATATLRGSEAGAVNVADALERAPEPWRTDLRAAWQRYANGTATKDDGRTITELGGGTPLYAVMASPAEQSIPAGFTPNTSAVGLGELPDGQTFVSLDGGTYVKHKATGNGFIVNKPVDAAGHVVSSDPNSAAKSYGKSTRILHEKGPPSAIGPMSPDYVDTYDAAPAPDPPSVVPNGWQVGDPSPGRGPSGKLRNFKAMKDEKLLTLLGELVNHPDQEAYQAAAAVAQTKGIMATKTPSAPTPTPAPPPTPAAPEGDLYDALKASVDAAGAPDTTSPEGVPNMIPPGVHDYGMFTPEGNAALDKLVHAVADAPSGQQQQMLDAGLKVIEDNSSTEEVSDTTVRDAIREQLTKAGAPGDALSIFGWTPNEPTTESPSYVSHAAELIATKLASDEPGTIHDLPNGTKVIKTQDAYMVNSPALDKPELHNSAADAANRAVEADAGADTSPGSLDDAAAQLGSGWDAASVQAALDDLANQGVPLDPNIESGQTLAAVIQAAGIEPQGHATGSTENTVQATGAPDVLATTTTVSAPSPVNQAATGTAHSPARSPKGNLRNFKAMSDAKLLGLADEMTTFTEDDPEAVQALVAQLTQRGLDMPVGLG